jgi:xanthine dehydrogenase accessory factor
VLDRREAHRLIVRVYARRGDVRDVLETLERWLAQGMRVATATVVKTERSAPRPPGAVLAVSEEGEVAGSVTGGCVEPAVFEEARAVLDGGPPRLVSYGIADEQAFEVGLPCGGTVHIFMNTVERDLIEELAAAVRSERPIALAVRISGAQIGEQRLEPLNGHFEPTLDGEEFVLPFAPRANMYVFGAVDHAAAVARVGRFLGYRVTVCDARAKFVTEERFPDVDELVVEWPDRFLTQAPVDQRTVICVLTHDHKFDIPLLQVALETPAGYIGAMGARRTNAERADRLRAEGVSEEALDRIHAPIGLDIGSRTPEEVAVAVGAEIVATFRGAKTPAGA